MGKCQLKPKGGTVCSPLVGLEKGDRGGVDGVCELEKLTPQLREQHPSLLKSSMCDPLPGWHFRIDTERNFHPHMGRPTAAECIAA